jgi:hypothetical protein
MKKLINNQGLTVEVSAEQYNKIYAAFLEGCCSVICSENGQSNIFILEHNF